MAAIIQQNSTKTGFSQQKTAILPLSRAMLLLAVAVAVLFAVVFILSRFFLRWAPEFTPSLRQVAAQRIFFHILY
jgi:hypothetical protein